MSAEHVPKEPKPDLLKLWMGEPDERAQPRRSPLHALLTVVLAAGGLVAAVVLAKYALDILVIVLALLVTGLVLHIVGTKVAESTWLSPGTFAIAAAFVALLGYAVFSPAGSAVRLGRYMPRPLVAFLEWSESRGWAQRALSAAPEPGSSPGSAAAPSSTPAAPAPVATPPASSGALTLGVSAPTSAAGQPLILTARAGDVAEGTEVSFFDGSQLIGKGTVRLQGAEGSASLTITTLAPGEHELSAEVPTTLGLSRRSDTVRHTVTAR
jgi:hypothetical protein